MAAFPGERWIPRSLEGLFGKFFLNRRLFVQRAPTVVACGEHAIANVQMALTRIFKPGEEEEGPFCTASLAKPIQNGRIMGVRSEA